MSLLFFQPEIIRQHFGDGAAHGVQMRYRRSDADYGTAGSVKNAEELLMVGDGNGEFTRAIGLEMDGSGFGLGTRSQRYAMIVEDGTVTKLSVEAPGQFEVSKAEAILEAL